MEIGCVIFIILLCNGNGLAGKGGSKDSGSSSECSSYSNSNNYQWRWWMTSGWWKKYYTGSDLHFNSGDHITCNIPGQSYVVFTPKHHLLATSSTTVAHSWGFDSHSKILEEDWTTGPSGLRDFFCNEICWVQTDEYAKGRSDAIQRARKAVDRFRGEDVHYNLLTCNCEHWVNYWMYDSAWSRQSDQYADMYCNL